MIINLIDEKKLILNKFGHYEYDFYPERKFDGEYNIFLYFSECWGNSQYCKLFYLNDLSNIKTIVFCNYNFFPLAANFAHKVILIKNESLIKSVFTENPRISNFKIRAKQIHKAYKIQDDKLCAIQYNRHYKEKTFLFKDEKETELIAEKYINSECYMFKKAYDNFFINENFFAKDKIDVEFKPRDLSKMGERLLPLKEQYNLWGLNREKEQIKTAKEFDAIYYYYSYQILASLYNNWAFVGTGGCGALFSISLFLNTLFISDHCQVMTLQRVFKEKINKKLYNCNVLYTQYSKKIKEESMYADKRFNLLLQAFENKKQTMQPEIIIKEI